VVADNGVGFLPGALPGEVANGRTPGSGLGSMRERTELSGGAFRLHTAPGRGTRIELAWRLDDEDV
jgi:two-component system, NarL family, sensor histidine kinase UhpB